MNKSTKEKVYLTEFPHLVEEWHPTKNGNLDPAKTTYGSNKKVWWVCRAGHEWAAQVRSRTSGNGCPLCAGRWTLAGFNDLATTHPELSKEWSVTNVLGPDSVSAGSHKRVWWVCAEHSHEWEARVTDRTRGKGCPVCANRQVLPGFNDLATTHPELVAEWSPKNNKGADGVTVSSTFMALWVCTEHSHEWAARIDNRTNGTGCPVCSNRKVLRGFNDLMTTHPELSKEWSPKNAFGPENVSVGSEKKVWWVCPLEHTWQATVANRALRGSGCPKCCLNRTSKIEGELCRLLSECLPDAEQGVRIGRWSVDVLFSEEKVVVEYDGSYFHKDALEKDTRKTLDLITRGYRVVRVREQSKNYTLPPLDTDDPHYLELTYAYSPDWSGLSDVVVRINSWVSTK